MPIDRIGKGGGVPPQPPAGGSSGAAPTTKTFEVEAPSKAGATRGAAQTEAVGAVGASPLDELKAGRIDVNTYVELKLDEATAHLHGLRPAELDQIRGMLRDKIVQDPHLVDLVRQATGSVPKPSDE